MMASQTERRRGPLSWIGARTLACVGVLVLLELGAHHLGNFGKWVVQEQSARYGWRMLPDQHGWSRDYDIPEVINAWGYRDERDWDPPRTDAEGRAVNDPGLFRVAVLGNSMTYGTSVAVEDTWPRELEALLDAELERRADARDALVMNFAVQGYTFEQMARVYDDQIRAWRPDLLIWPLIPPDVRPMRPARDDAEYGLRRSVIRTATYDLLRHYVIHKWIPEPAREAPAPDAASGKQRLWEALEPGLRETLEELYGAAWLEDQWPGLAERAREALERAPLDRAVGRVVKAITGELPAPSDGIDATLAVWSAVERDLPEEAWSHLDTNFKNAPFAPQHEFLWEMRGRRMMGILADLERNGGRLVLHALPSMPRLVYAAPSPLVYWAGTWQSVARERGHVPVLIDGQVAFEAPMAELVAEILRRGWVEGPVRDELGPDYAGLDQSLFLMRDPTHYNAAGHELLARDLFEQLRRSGVLAGSVR